MLTTPILPLTRCPPSLANNTLALFPGLRRQASAVSLKYKGKMLVCKQEKARLDPGWVGQRPRVYANLDKATRPFLCSYFLPYDFIRPPRRQAFTSSPCSYLTSHLGICWPTEAMGSQTESNSALNQNHSVPQQPRESLLFPSAQ